MKTPRCAIHSVLIGFCLFVLLNAARPIHAQENLPGSHQDAHQEVKPKLGTKSSAETPSGKEHGTHAAMPAAGEFTPPKDWPKPVKNELFSFVLFDQLEYRANDGIDTIRWDVTGWCGGDYNKLWIKTEGDQQLSGKAGGEIENQFLYSRMFTPFWDAQIGVRYDQAWGPGSNPSRTFAAIGLEGFAPYRFEVEPALFISEDGDVSAKFTTSADLFLTQRLILQPRFDMEVAAQDAERFGIGQGFNNVELGLRLRYEIRHRFAPYIGVHWRRLLGETAGLARRGGEDVETIGAVIGLRLWF